MAVLSLDSEPRHIELEPGEPDPIGVVEAAYQSGSRSQWLGRVFRSLAPLLDRGGALAAYLAMPSEDLSRVTIATPYFANAGPEFLHGLNRAAGAATFEVMAGVYRVEPLSHREVLAHFSPEAAAFDQDCFLPSVGAKDVLRLRVDLDRGAAVGFMALSQGPVRMSPARKSMLEQVAAHIAAGYRLRERAEGILNEAECVLSGDGRRVLHADGAACSAAGRSALSEAAQRQLAARGRLREQDPETAVRVWEGLVEGRWSLVCQRDTDGKRLLVARKNPPDFTDPRSLSHRERQVVALTARSHSLQLVAYELGLSRSRVSALLSSAQRKLGLASRAELVRLTLALPSVHHQPAPHDGEATSG
ncbi:MAG: helix-turn-helix transcriptional regulator [Myxococcales bacterium]|nr:helix-turn-helix transcriptional regulator [Myxococcales bacterium]